MSKIKVLVVDDSKLMQQLLSEILSSDENIEVIATASDPYEARDLIKAKEPDVITLDIEMPKMNGMAFLKNLMRLHPVPTVMVSTLTDKSSQITFDALRIGAVDFLCKPKMQTPNVIEEFEHELIEKVKIAKIARLEHFADVDLNKEVTQLPLDKNLSNYKIVAIGASTGGLEAILEIIQRYPQKGPGVVITQHIPPGYSRSFANRLNGMVSLEVQEATHNSQILPGYVYIAPGDQHLIIKRVGDTYVCKLNSKEKVNKHRPSVDVLFESVAREAGNRSIGILLTGMGSDGAKGLKSIKETGGHTIVQDEETSVVWGMPGCAVRMGANTEVLGLNKIVPKLIRIFNTKNSPAATREAK